MRPNVRQDAVDTSLRFVFVLLTVSRSRMVVLFVCSSATPLPASLRFDVRRLIPDPDPEGYMCRLESRDSILTANSTPRVHYITVGQVWLNGRGLKVSFFQG